MEKILYFDSQGRLYIPEEIRRMLKFRTLIAKILDKGIFLEPIEDDPIEALSKLGKGKLKHKSIEQLKKEARAEIEKNAIKKIRRHWFLFSTYKRLWLVKRKSKKIVQRI